MSKRKQALQRASVKRRKMNHCAELSNGNSNRTNRNGANVERELNLICNAIDSMKATELKSFMRRLKDLDIGNGVDCKMTGKKADLQKRLKANCSAIWNQSIESTALMGDDDYEAWKREIKQIVLLSG